MDASSAFITIKEMKRWTAIVWGCWASSGARSILSVFRIDSAWSSIFDAQHLRLLRILEFSRCGAYLVLSMFGALISPVSIYDPASLRFSIWSSFFDAQHLWVLNILMFSIVGAKHIWCSAFLVISVSTIQLP